MTKKQYLKAKEQALVAGEMCFHFESVEDGMALLRGILAQAIGALEKHAHQIDEDDEEDDDDPIVSARKNLERACGCLPAAAPPAAHPWTPSRRKNAGRPFAPKKWSAGKKNTERHSDRVEVNL